MKEKPLSEKEPKEGLKDIQWNKKISFRQSTAELYTFPWEHENKYSAIYSWESPAVQSGRKTSLMVAKGKICLPRETKFS